MTPKLQEDAKKKTRGADGARELLKEADEVWLAKGKNVAHFDLKKVALEDVVPMMLGPTGNLRAPTVRKGRTVVVGFNKEAYEKLLG